MQEPSGKRVGQPASCHIAGSSEVSRTTGHRSHGSHGSKSCSDILCQHACHGSALAEAQSQLDGNGRILVRYSGTENKVRVMVEGPDQSLITRIAEMLRDVLKDEIS